MAKQSKFSGIYERGVSGLFLAALLLPFLLTFFSPGGTSVAERRLLAARPRMGSLEDLFVRFPRDFDAFVADNFGFRGQLVALHYRLARGPLKAPILHDALLGKDGWMYWGNEEALVDIRGDAEPPSRKRLVFWLGALEQRREWLKELGAKFLLVIAPDKPSIYPEHLPDGVRAPGGATALDRLMAFLGGDARYDWILNLKPALLAGKAVSKRQLYYLADSHWTAAGAYWAWRAIEEALAKQGIVFHTPIRETDIFDSGTRNAAGEFLFNPEPSEFGPHYEVRHPSLGCIRPGKPVPVKELPELETLTEITTCATGRFRAVVLKDSFTELLKPFLSSSFARVVYLNLGDRNRYSRKLIEAEKPDIVLYEVVERRLALRYLLWEQEGYQPWAKLFYLSPWDTGD